MGLLTIMRPNTWINPRLFIPRFYQGVGAQLAGIIDEVRKLPSMEGLLDLTKGEHSSQYRTVLDEMLPNMVQQAPADLTDV